jgi:hypothetical protein
MWPARNSLLNVKGSKGKNTSATAIPILYGDTWEYKDEGKYQNLLLGTRPYQWRQCHIFPHANIAMGDHQPALGFY